ncbi:MAG: TIGR03960 family B12-binding radical SAM protein [Candidatus Marinimicrobia bacterium]|nr:TIGR03960 family B12-binding radical SAM protein [Candidatus Neomarinimicrobiota bacterium]
MFPVVEKPGRYTGNEFNARRKDFSKAQASIVLAYPDVYDVGMSYYGFQILYHILNREKTIIADRVYAPWTDFEQQLRVRSLALYGLESNAPVRQFDVLGFTLPYELTTTNVLNILDLSQISVLSEKRNDKDPIVIAGGTNAYNPEPLAPFIDVFVIGDSEDIIVPLVEFIAKRKKKGVPRQGILYEMIREFKGLYIPRFYTNQTISENGFILPRPISADIPDRIISQRVPFLKADYFPEKPIIPLIEIAQDRLVAEIMRGCTQGCRFCQAGMIYRPVRERFPEDIKRQVENSLKATGYENLSLLSLSSLDYNGMEELIDGISGLLDCRRIGLSLPSLRLDSFSEEIAYIARKTRKSGLTFAPEAGTERLRRVINKKITEEDLLCSVEIALQYGWRSLKLYFMLGLPTETDEDILAIASLTDTILKHSKKRLSLNITLSTFVPKPFTPFQWEAQDSREEIQRKLDILKPLLKKSRRVKVMARNPFYSQLEGVLARGDRKIADVIYDAWKLGARFDTWREFFDPAIWEKAFQKNNIDHKKYICKRNEDEILSWDHIDSLIEKNFLLKEREKTYRGEITPDCRDGCVGCGVCDPEHLSMNLVQKSEADRKEEKAKEVVIDEERIKYQIRYRKTGLVRFISHLDIMRLFQRALRRADLDLAFTQGFNKRPIISSGYPLPLGYSSEDEYLEVILKSEAKDIVNRLNEQLPVGMMIESASIIPLKSASIFSRVKGFDYEIQVFRTIPEDIKAKIQMFLKCTEILVERVGKDRKKVINVRKFVNTIKVVDQRILLSMRVLDGQTARPGEILPELGINENIHICRKKTHLQAN